MLKRLQGLLNKIGFARKANPPLSVKEDRYGYAVGGKAGMPLRKFVEAMIAKTGVPDDQQRLLEDLAQRGTVVYALKYRSQLDFLFLNLRLFQLGLPTPGFIFDLHPYLLQPRWYAFKLCLYHLYRFARTGFLPNPYEGGYYRDKMAEGKSGLLFLLGQKGYYQRSVLVRNDPLDHLLDVQKEIERPIFLVPIALLYSRAPARPRRGILELFLGHKEQPGTIWKLVSYIKSYPTAVIEVGEPLDLQRIVPELSERESEWRKQVFQLRRAAIESVDKMERAVVGPILKSKLELKETIFHHPRLESFVRRRAKAGGQEMWKIRREADRYLEEIAADYSYTVILVGVKILNWVWNNLFNGVEIDMESLRKVKRAARRSTLVYIPCHKSHIDYLILSYVLFENSLYPPYVAAGKNLSFWPLGPLFRRGGAFFIRRSFKGNKFYAEVFSLYVKTMVQLGHNIEFFIEGGRSRTGKMVLPKLGLMAILIQAVEEGFCDDLVFVPTSICYDRIPEEEAYVREITGGVKVDENIKQLVNARRFLKRRYGRVYVKFADPISLRRYMERHRLDLNKMPSKMRHAVYRDFSYRIINRINEASLVTPHALVAASFLSTARRGIAEPEFESVCRIFHDYLTARGVTFSKTFKSYDSIIDDTLRDLERSKLIEKLKDEDDNLEEEVFTVEDGKRITLEYYKNNIIHFLLPAAFVSTSILAQQTFRFSFTRIVEDVAFLKDFFKTEFVYDNDVTDTRLINDVLDIFTKLECLHPLDQDDQPYILSHKGLKAADFFHGLIRNYFEGYWVVLRAFRYLQKKQYPEKELVKKMMSLGEKALKLGLIERPESISKILFGDALKYYVEKGVVQKKAGDEKGKDKEQDYYSDTGDRYLIHYYSKQISHYMRTPRFTLH